jgi:hypothetical protein
MRATTKSIGVERRKQNMRGDDMQRARIRSAIQRPGHYSVGLNAASITAVVLCLSLGSPKLRAQTATITVDASSVVNSNIVRTERSDKQGIADSTVTELYRNLGGATLHSYISLAWGFHDIEFRVVRNQ